MVGEKCPGCISLEWASASHLKWMKPHWSVQSKNCFSQALVSSTFSVWISCRDCSGLAESWAHGPRWSSHCPQHCPWAVWHSASAWFGFALLVFLSTPARGTPHTLVCTCSVGLFHGAAAKWLSCGLKVGGNPCIYTNICQAGVGVAAFL